MSTKVPDEEIEFRASRSGGPGGQHANRRATRVEARWNVKESPSLTEEERERILRRLEGRISKDGTLRVVSEEERSQHRNRQLATQRLRELVGEALEVRKRRKPTRAPKSAQEARLREKQHRRRVKRQRRPPTPEE
jgi:ribosome-associated protein